MTNKYDDFDWEFYVYFYDDLQINNINTNKSALDHWINYNLNSRYSISTSVIVDDNKQVVKVIEVGFEDPKELLMLTLGCPHLIIKN